MIRDGYDLTVWLIGVCFLVLVILAFTGCSGLTAADRYVSSEQFGDSGATRCGVVHEHPVLLEPCE